MNTINHAATALLIHRKWPGVPIAPGIASHLFGTGLYDIPWLALIVETAYGVLCWRLFQGTRALLAVILVFNLGAISFYSAAIPGPENFMAGRPDLFAGFIGVHIVMGLLAIGFFARSSWRTTDVAA